MFPRQHRTIGILVFAGALFLVGAGFGRAVFAQPKGDEARLKQLMRDRLGVRKEIVELYTSLRSRGGASAVEVLLSTREMLWAELDTCETNQARVTQLERIVQHEKAISAFFEKTPDLSRAERLQLRVRLLDAEVTLEKARLQ